MEENKDGNTPQYVADIGKLQQGQKYYLQGADLALLSPGGNSLAQLVCHDLFVRQGDESWVLAPTEPTPRGCMAVFTPH